MKYTLLTVCIAALTPGLHASEDFTVDLNGIRSSVATTVDGTPALFVSETAGSVACYSTEGKQLWVQRTTDPAVLFELEAADLDGDGQDELLTASANGHITCYNHDGVERWTFHPGHKVRFSEVAVVNEGKGARVFAGGNDFTLYELNSNGELQSKTKLEGVVRTLEAGNFVDANQDSLFIMTYRHDKFGWAFMGYMDPTTKQVLKDAGKSSGLSKEWRGFMLTDASVDDINQDGRADMLFFGTTKAGIPGFIGLDGELEQVAVFTGNRKHKQRYAHTIGTSLLPVRNEIAIQYGGVSYICDLKGNLLQTVGEKHRGIIYNDLTLVKETGELFAAGQIGGGNTFYRYQLSNDDWWQTQHQLQGRMQEVEQNLETLYQQALEFERPSYQKAAERPWVMITSVKPSVEVAAKEGDDILFVKQYTWHEDFDRSDLEAVLGDVAHKRDGRGNYNRTRAELVALAKDHEARGEPFTAWTGHGNDPFYTSIDTMEAVLEAAPNTCYGFIYAEMSNPLDTRYHHFIDHYVPRLAKAMRKHGKAKLYFRYKNVFWAASSHLAPWDRLFFSGKYSDILVPSSEDTNSRTQDINFAGRVGMLAGGYVDDVAMRLVDDNPTCWRPLSPGGQRSVSPYLRNGVILAGYGSRSGILFPIGYLEQPGYNVLFSLMKSGVLPEVNCEDIESIGSWHLMEDVDEKLVHEIDDGHNMELYKPTDEDAVFAVGAVNWCGASVPAHDFSKLLGVDYRWLNFVPEMPNGMVPIAPIQYANELKKQGVAYTVSDGRVGKVNGKDVPAKQFGPILKQAVEQGAKTMPVVVSGASWSAIRLDVSHIRVILVDPGYIDPQARTASIRFQGDMPKSATDILSKQVLDLSGRELSVTVPAGSVRFIDLAY